MFITLSYKHTMKKILIIIAVGIKAFSCMAQNDTPMTNGRMSADSTKYIVNIEGKEIEFSLKILLVG